MDYSTFTTPRKVSLLVSFADIQGFAAMARTMPDPLEVFDMLNGFARVCHEAVTAAGGRVIKFIGDSCLSVFAAEEAGRGVRGLLKLKADAEAYLASRGHATKLHVLAHVGEVALGPFGAGESMGLDVLGDAVNVTATLGRGERRGTFLISPQAFRALDADERKLFHKYTPPIFYVAEEGAPQYS